MLALVGHWYGGATFSCENFSKLALSDMVGATPSCQKRCMSSCSPDGARHIFVSWKNHYTGLECRFDC